MPRLSPQARSRGLCALAVLLVGAAPAHAAEGGGVGSVVWPIANFAILIGLLYYFLRQPLSGYLAGRHAQIRKDLVAAAELEAAAAVQLAEIERKVQALPGELDSLRERGRQEIAAEEQRIAAAGAAERDRLIGQARQQISLELRLARRELVEHAANLSVQLATERIERDLTRDDHVHLIDRYLEQVSRAEASRPGPKAD